MMYARITNSDEDLYNGIDKQAILEYVCYLQNE